MFRKATKIDLNLRLAIHGPSGSGKTRSALEIAKHLGESIAVIDTEHSSSRRYAHLYDFDHQDLTDFNPAKYVKTIHEARGKYEVLIIDSLSHAWGWELETVDKNFRNWAIVRPAEKQLLQAILSFPGHIIVTMRSKTEWLLQDGTNKAGKSTTIPKKVGTAPVQSPQIEYEFDLVLEMSMEHTGRVTKSHFDCLDQGEFVRPGKDFAVMALSALREGGDPPKPSERENLIAEIGTLVTELGWDEEQSKKFLRDSFEKTSRNKLSDDELRQCHDQLQLEKSNAAITQSHR